MPARSHSASLDHRPLVRLGPDGVVWLKAAGSGDPDVLVPSEYAPVFAADLPLAQLRLRMEALPFAVEERLSQPLDEMHVALGPEIAPRRYLAGVVAIATLRRWMDVLSAARISPRRIIPDATLLPEPGAGWSVAVNDGRVLVRTREGEAFAASPAIFDAMWNAAGRPDLQQVGPAWLSELPPATVASEAVSPSGAARFEVDLLQGWRVGGEIGLRKPFAIAAGILAATALAHTMLLAVDTAVATRAADQRLAEAGQMLAALAPNMAGEPDPVAALERMLPEPGAAGERSWFLPLLSRVSIALQPVSAGLAFQALTYDSADAALVIRIETSDLAALETVQQSLRDAGLDAQSSGSTVGDGRAESTLIVRGGAEIAS